MNTDKFKELLYKTKSVYEENKRWFQIGIPALVYTLGVLSTGINRSEPGFNLNPLVAIPTLFSPSGKALILLLILIPFGIWGFLKVRGLEHAGMTRDEQRNFWFSDKDTYGTAELMDDYRMRQCFNCVPERECWKAEGDIIGIKDGLVLSRPEKSQHNKHMAVIGASGSMKSRAIVRNKIIGSKRRGESMVVTDPKGELFRDTAIWLRKSGYIVRALNLVSLDKSSGWNFMADALQNCQPGEEIEIVDQMAHVIIQNTGGTADGHSKDDFWDKGERGLLKAIMLYQYYVWQEGTGALSFSWAYKFLLDNDVDHMKDAFTALGARKPTNAATPAFNIFLKAGEKICPNIHFGLLSRLDLFRNAQIQRITSTDEIDLELPAREKCAYFVITPDQHSTYDFLAALFFTLLFIRLVKYADTKTTAGKCDVPVNLLLDEFPNIGEIPDFPKKIATVRSRQINITILFQSLPDLTERYPEPGHWRILNNCDYIIFLGGGDPNTADYFSKRSGEATIMVDTTAESHNKLDPLHFTLDQRESVGAGRRMVLTLNEIQTMAKDNPYVELIVMRDQPILQCEKFDYTRDPESQKWEVFAMTDYDPADPFWAVENEADEDRKPQASEKPPAEDLPRRKKKGAKKPDPAEASPTTPVNEDPAPASPPEQPPEQDEPSGQPEPALDPQPESFAEAQAKSERNTLDFMRRQAAIQKAANAPQNESTKHQKPSTHGSIPGLKKPLQSQEGQQIGSTANPPKANENRPKGSKAAPPL